MLASLLLSLLLQGPVVINELQYDDSGTDDREFVELYNGSTQPVDISGWKLESEDPLGPNTTYTIPANTILQAGAFWVIGSGLVPRVNQIVGANDLWDNENTSLTLRNASAAIVDTLVYEANKGVWPNAKTLGLLRGEGIWGNFTSIDLLETSWQRPRDGIDFRNNRVFHLLPWTPGKTNNLAPALPWANSFDALAVDADVPGWGGSFYKAKVIDPGTASPTNPSAIKPSPQGGRAAVFWDPAGGGNSNMLLGDMVRNVVVEAWVYLDATLRPTNEYESWSLGVQGTTCTYYNTPDPSGQLGGLTANGDTGVTATFQVTSKDAFLYLIDHNDGGWGSAAATAPAILGKIAIQAGVNDGWQRLRLQVSGARAELFFGGTYGCGDGTRLMGPLTQPQFGGVYIGYRELMADNTKLRPFTCDALRISVPSAGLQFYGTATKTTKGTPTIDANGLPVLGFAGFQITGSGLVPSQATLVVLGTATANIDLAPAGGQPGLTLLALPLLLGVAPTDAQGQAAVTLPLPCDAGLSGANLHWQILDIDAALTYRLPLANSQGLTTTLGF